MKKITELIKPFMAIIFGVLLLLTYLNLLSSEEGKTLAIGICAVVISAYYFFIGIFGILGPKLRGVAKKIAAVTGGDLYEILPAEPYTSEDLNWNDKESRSTKEQNDKSSRPAIGSNRIDVSAYSTIYIGFPIWWGEEPRIMDTFVESYKFNGITLVPFCTSGGSGIGRSGPNMEALAGSGTWLDGKRFSSGVSESELQSWIDGLQ